jgi:ribosome maturation factor RimP
MSKVIESRITGLVATDIEAAGYDLVRVHLSGGGKYAALQIMAERKDGIGMNVEDCAAISRIVIAKFEGEKDLVDRYDLEVSSPGIDRPLMKPQDYVRFQGHVAKVELNTAIEGQRRFQGKIAEVSNDEIMFDVSKAVLKVPFTAIEKAKLVLTDELLKAAKAAAK